MPVPDASPWGIELACTLESIKVKVMVADNSWHNLRPARLAGLSVFYGEILSEFAEESVEISHIQTVLAATSNDAYFRRNGSTHEGVIGIVAGSRQDRLNMTDLHRFLSEF